MNEKLKPCPCCGGEGAVWDKSRYDVCVRCDACELQTKWHPTISDAIAAWNRRAGAWISVDERLPEVGDDVIICLNIYDNAVTVGFYSTSSKWMMPRCDRILPLDKVTHWQPLPEGPKGEDDGR